MWATLSLTIFLSLHTGQGIQHGSPPPDDSFIVPIKVNNENVYRTGTFVTTTIVLTIFHLYAQHIKIELFFKLMHMDAENYEGYADSLKAYNLDAFVLVIPLPEDLKVFQVYRIRTLEVIRQTKTDERYVREHYYYGLEIGAGNLDVRRGSVIDKSLDKDVLLHINDQSIFTGEDIGGAVTVVVHGREVLIGLVSAIQDQQNIRMKKIPEEFLTRYKPIDTTVKIITAHNTSLLDKFMNAISYWLDYFGFFYVIGKIQVCSPYKPHKQQKT